MPPHDIRLVIPASREALGVVRAVVAGVANSNRLGYDRVEEARLVVNEAAALLLKDGKSRWLSCDLSVNGRFQVAITADPGPLAWPPPDFEGSLEQIVLSTVTDEFELMTGERPGVRLAFSAGT